MASEHYLSITAEYLAQCSAVGLGSTRDFTVHVDRTCGGQCRDLRLDALAVVKTCA